MSESVIEARNLCKKYGEKYALKDVNLKIEKGEVFAVMGSSGAGKTTLLRLLNLLEAPTCGEIYFFGKEASSIRGSERLELRRRMALVAQGAPLFRASVFDNVAYGLRVRGYSRSYIKNKVSEALEMVGLKGYENRNARTLSGGEMQRVAFAMATIFSPDVLFLDEPTANLDPIREKAIEDIIMKINKIGITVVLATHKQNEAISLADKIAVLYNGQIEQIGSPEEIFYKPRSRVVAEFVGTENVIDGVVEFSNGREVIIRTSWGFRLSAAGPGLTKGDLINVCIRPEEIMIIREDIPVNPKHKNILTGVIAEIHPQGGAMFRIKLKNPPLIIDVPRHVVDKMALKEGKKIRVSLKLGACHLIRA